MESDATACAAIYAPYVSHSVISFETQAPTPAEMADRIRRTQVTHPWLVAETEEQVVGFAYGAPHHERAAYRWAADVSVYIDRAHHRRGLGRRLYEELFALLRRQHMHVACAGVTLPNESSVRLHESLGFEPVGVYRRIGFKDAAWHDVGWWQLQLIEPAGTPQEPLPPAGA